MIEIYMYIYKYIERESKHARANYEGGKKKEAYVPALCIYTYIYRYTYIYIEYYRDIYVCM